MTLHDRAIALIERLRQASQGMACGQIPDMAHFAKETNDLCQGINMAPPQDALAMKPLLAELITGLDHLVTDLEQIKNGKR
ncbi:MAG: hypothetical protein L6Q57_05980 [Alphaproteobacteria bacterium]|nr:hypothetical protein [Alphaproteobacteria bacterium]